MNINGLEVQVHREVSPENKSTLLRIEILFLHFYFPVNCVDIFSDLEMLHF